MIQHVCCGKWFSTADNERQHRKNCCPYINALRRKYRTAGPTTVAIGDQLITARTPAWETP